MGMALDAARLLQLNYFLAPRFFVPVFFLVDLRRAALEEARRPLREFRPAAAAATATPRRVCFGDRSRKLYRPLEEASLGASLQPLLLLGGGGLEVLVRSGLVVMMGIPESLKYSNTLRSSSIWQRKARSKRLGLRRLELVSYHSAAFKKKLSINTLSIAVKGGGGIFWVKYTPSVYECGISVVH